MGTNNIGSKEDCAFMRIRLVFMHSQIALYYIAWGNLIYTLYFKLNVGLLYLSISLIRNFFAPAMLGWLENKNCSGIDAPGPGV